MIPGLDRWLVKHPDYEQFVSPLHVTDPYTIELGLFKKGIDNVHIDVCLSQEFKERSRILARKILQHHVAENFWGEPPPPPSSSDVQAMKDGYAGVMEMAVGHASQFNQPELIQLLQLATIKFFLQLIDQEYERLRGQLREARVHEHHDSTSRSVEAHERLVILAKNESAIRYKLSRKLFREILWVERTRVSKLRKSVLGSSWQLPKQMLFNPLLQIPSLWADEQLMNHYTLACTAKDNLKIFKQVNRIITGLFEDYLPEWSRPCIAQKRAPALQPGMDDSLAALEGVEQNNAKYYNQIRRLLVGALQAEEFESGLMSWLDSVQNLDRIIYSTRPNKSNRFEGCENIITSSWVDANWPAYYNHLLRLIYKEFRRSRIDVDVLACQMAPEVYKALRTQLPVRLICRYLAGHINRREMHRRLGSLSVTLSHQAIMRTLDEAMTELGKMPQRRRRKQLLTFVSQFVHLRRDLKLAYRTLRAMNRIRLLEEEDDLDLSRNNDTLYEFVLRGELQPKQRQIRNHVILKADVRGSTDMTQQLKQKGLNPATHFSLNFFKPINQLLKIFGARKVFVEGDAVILSVFEYEDTPFQWICVAHACGLARKILQVVDAQNIKNGKYGLPDLELGLGIAFSDSSPAFLFDEEREIMISSAINRADQLSSCSALIKRSDYALRRGRGIEVFRQAAGEVQDKEASDHLLRYNVNGIELDLPAFYKLKTELSLRPIKVNDSPHAEGSQYFAARYPDLEGHMHWLVIREGVVREWQQSDSAPQNQARRFYEVVTDPDLIREIRRRAAGGSRVPDEPEELAEMDEPAIGTTHYYH